MSEARTIIEIPGDILRWLSAGDGTRSTTVEADGQTFIVMKTEQEGCDKFICADPAMCSEHDHKHGYGCMTCSKQAHEHPVPYLTGKDTP